MVLNSVNTSSLDTRDFMVLNNVSKTKEIFMVLKCVNKSSLDTRYFYGLK